MKPTITAFESSPDRGLGLARDTRIRWALEEVGQPYDVRLVSFPALKQPPHLALNPFGQIPTYEEGDLVLFESGAIVFHIAETHEGLPPKDPAARARALMWMFAAVNTMELPILDFAYGRFTEGKKPWYEERVVMVKDRIRNYFYNPPFNNVNLGLFKEFQIKESHKLLFRAEGFDVFNHPNWSGVDGGPRSGTFGKVTTKTDDRRNIQLSLRYMF